MGDDEAENFRRSAGLRESQSDFQLFDRLAAKLDKKLAALAAQTKDLADKVQEAGFEAEKDSVLESLAATRESLERLEELNDRRPLTSGDVGAGDVAADSVLRDRHAQRIDGLRGRVQDLEDAVLALSLAKAPLRAPAAASAPTEPPAEFPKAPRAKSARFSLKASKSEPRRPREAVPGPPPTVKRSREPRETGDGGPSESLLAASTAEPAPSAPPSVGFLGAVRSRGERLGWLGLVLVLLLLLLIACLVFALKLRSLHSQLRLCQSDRPQQ